MMNDRAIRIEYVDLPFRVKGMTVRSYDDGEHWFTILLNAGLNREQQRAAYLHELSHIENDDFSSCRSADEIEGCVNYGY